MEKKIHHQNVDPDLRAIITEGNFLLSFVFMYIVIIEKVYFLEVHILHEQHNNLK